MVKRIIAIVLCVALLAGIGVGAWYFLSREVTYNGTVENSHAITLTMADNTFYDVLVPNEAVLLETDECSIYRYDLLTIAVRDTEPVDNDFKTEVAGRWVYIESKDNWLAPTLHGFDVNKPYTYDADYEYTTTVNEAGEEVPAVWDDGPAPYSDDFPTVNEGASIYELNDYVIYQYEYLMWEDAVAQQLDRLCLKTNSYIPHYFNNGDVFYASIGDYTVGCIHNTYNGQWTVIARGANGTREALALLMKGMKT